MKFSSALARRIDSPNGRGGSSTDIVKRDAPTAETFIAKVLYNLQTDQNLIYLAARLQNYSELTDARMYGLRRAIEAQDSEAITMIAQALTDSTAKLGAIKLMKIAIALQMLGRRGMVQRAADLVAELEAEYETFKDSLISAVR